MVVIILKFQDGLSTQRFKMEAVRCRLKDMIRRKLTFGRNYRIVKWGIQINRYDKLRMSLRMEVLGILCTL